MKLSKNLRSPAAAGFTLIEVSLAIGIAAIALVALLALVPQGLKTMKLAADTAIEARIHQQIVAEISLADWDKRTKYDYQESNELFFFDDQGIRILEETFEAAYSGETFEDQAIYSARIHVPTRGGSLPMRVGGGSYEPIDYSGDPADENEVQLIMVEISSSPRVRSVQDFDEKDNWRNINTFQGTLTRLIDRRTIGGS
ncbi:MAG: hypothetical protein ACI8UO_000426 [Verrucomicrobiales bacterium]|jgi:uncharacterized protein (TIGR02598 family)